MSRIRIVSEEGDPRKTHVLLDGHELPGVSSVRWEIDARGVGRAEIVFADVDVAVEANEGNVINGESVRIIERKELGNGGCG